MAPAELIAAIRQSNADIIPDVFVALYKFSPVEGEEQTYDANLKYRTAVVEELLPDFSLQDIHLIRSLFHEEMECEAYLWRHDNLYQLCYYLYELAQLEDVFILYDAKFNAHNMDVGTMLDREMILLRHEPQKVMQYVADRFIADPDLEIQYPKILMDLQGLIDYPDNDVASYTENIGRYFGKNKD
jgi:hypothetical protein